MRNLAFFLLILSAAVLLASCKLRIVVPRGGDVASESGAYSCPSGWCDVDVVDFYFDETFVARPHSGYRFDGWKKADRFFCGNNKEAYCRITTTGFEDDAQLSEIIRNFLESDEVFYLEPVFATKCSGEVPGDKNAFTLHQGEYTLREVRVPSDKDGDPYTKISTYFEGCPTGVCSSRTVSQGPKYDVDELRFSPTPETPPGVYKIHYQAYKTRLGWFLGYFTWPEKKLKEWSFNLTVVECPE